MEVNGIKIDEIEINGIKVNEIEVHRIKANETEVNGIKVNKSAPGPDAARERGGCRPFSSMSVSMSKKLQRRRRLDGGLGRLCEP